MGTVASNLTQEVNEEIAASVAGGLFNVTTALLPDMKLSDLESAANTVYKELAEAEAALPAAQAQAESAEQAYKEALHVVQHEDRSPESLERLTEARETMEAANAAMREAETAVETARAQAQAASELVEQKKDLLRESRHGDNTYVVHCARIECTYGMRDSYLALGLTHGVKTRQIPQMVISDAVLNVNIINFGGCRSRENPSLKEAAEEAARLANQEIEDRKKKGFFNRIIDFFCGDGQVEVSDSLLAQCVGECKKCLPADAEWKNGHMKVFINGKPVLLRKCSTRCIYGGQITILLSGQPE